MGQGLPVPAPGMISWDRLFDLPQWLAEDRGHEDRGDSVAQNWYLSGLAPPAPIEISWSWITKPIRFRQDKPLTHASVSKTSGGGTAISRVNADEQVSFTATLDTVNDVDATNRAHFVTTYYDTVRTRLATVRFVLNSRTTEELWLLLGTMIGTRFTITDAPVSFPIGATSLVVEGIRRSSRNDVSYLEWTTSPLIGETVGEVGPFFRVGVSSLGGTDLLPW